MSIKISSLVWELDMPSWEGPPASTAAKYVLLAFADYADDKGICYPSIETIARRTGMSEASVYRVMDKLKALGLLVKVRGHGPFQATTYQVKPLSLQGLDGSQTSQPERQTIIEPPGTRKPSRFSSTEPSFNQRDDFFERRYRDGKERKKQDSQLAIERASNQPGSLNGKRSKESK